MERVWPVERVWPGTAVPEDVNLCRGAVPAGPGHPDLDEGVGEILRDGDVNVALAGQVQRGGRVGILPVEHLWEQGTLSEFHVNSLDHLQEKPGHAGRTLYPVTADSSALASTGSHLMLTEEPEKLQEMFPGGFFGAEGCKTRQGLDKSEACAGPSHPLSLGRAVGRSKDVKQEHREQSLGDFGGSCGKWRAQG